MTTPDPSRAAFEKWRVQERRNRIPEFQKWPDDVLMVMLNCEPEREWKIWQAAMAHKELERWQPIESAPKNKTILIGYRNTHGHWRTLRGEWFSVEEINEMWEDPEGVEPGWFETSVEADDVPNVWRTDPTHWRPLPAAPLPQGE